MILTVDIGNSNIVLAIFNNNNEIVKLWRILASKEKTSKEYITIIQQLIKTDNISIEKIKGIILSSIVSQLTETIKESLSFINAKILIIGDKEIKNGLELQQTIASDIQMNIVAGKKKFKENFIIIDMGTATTFDIVINNGKYGGHIITPGIELGTKALFEFCSEFPLIEIKKPEHFLSDNITEILKSGIYYSYIGTIKEIIFQIQNYYKDINFKIYITGGVSSILVYDLKFIDGICPNLTSEGLNEIWHLNNK